MDQPGDAAISEESAPDAGDSGDRDSWTDVRDSWVSEPPPRVDVQIVMPSDAATPELAGLLEPGSSAGGEADRGEALMDVALQALAASDFEAALIASQTVLRTDPGHVDAVQCAELARKELIRIYEARLGSSMRVPCVVAGRSHAELGAAARCLLEQVDGQGTVAQVIDHANLKLLEGLKLLSELYLEDFIRLPHCTSTISRVVPTLASSK